MGIRHDGINIGNGVLDAYLPSCLGMDGMTREAGEERRRGGIRRLFATDSCLFFENT